MKRIIKTALMAAVATLISVTVCQTTKAQGDKAGLEKTANAFLEAVKAKDTAKLKPYYTDDYTYIGADGKIMSAEERLKALAAADAMVIDSFSEIKVRTYGSTGVLTGMNRGKTSSGAAEQDRFTQTWTWKGGHWLLAASHVSKIAP